MSYKTFRNGITTISSRNLHELIEKKYRSNIDIRKKFSKDEKQRIDSIELSRIVDDLAGQNALPKAWNNSTDRGLKGNHNISRDSNAYDSYFDQSQQKALEERLKRTKMDRMGRKAKSVLKTMPYS